MTEADLAHLSIGEVLSLLQEEFPDVTISKIRFLESQGLIDPERTPSGYRKFYEADVERLRWILQQQRDHFLPLKVIKDRLIDADRANMALDFSPPPDHVELNVELPLEQPAPDDQAQSVAADLDEDPTPPAESGDDGHDPEPIQRAGELDAAATEPEPSADVPEVATAPQLAIVEDAQPDTHNPMDLGPTEMSLTADELSRMSGLTVSTLDELREAGLLVTRQVGADRFFDSDSVVVARTAAKFAEFGVETRHLRMYKVASEREAGFFEQVIMPLLKQRNPTSRQRAVEQVATMAGLGQQLHAALLRQALDDSLG